MVKRVWGESRSRNIKINSFFLRFNLSSATAPTMKEATPFKSL